MKILLVTLIILISIAGFCEESKKEKIMKRNVILGVDKVTWGEFPSCVKNLVKFMKNEEMDLDYLIAMSGEAFRMAYDGKNPNPGIFHVKYNPEIVTHTLDMLGAKYRLIPLTDFENCKKEIMATVDKGIPALIIEGPVNCSGTNIITGYDDFGNVLLGESPHAYIPDDHTEPADETGYYRKSNWFSFYNSSEPKSDNKLIIIESIGKSLSEKEIYLSTFKLASKLIKGTRKDYYYFTGYDAHNLFAEKIVTKGDSFVKLYLGDYVQSYATDSMTNWFLLICTNVMYSDKAKALPFIKSGKPLFPEYEKEFNQLIENYESIFEITESMNKLPGLSNPDAMNDSVFIKSYANGIITIRDLEAKSALIFDKITVK